MSGGVLGASLETLTERTAATVRGMGGVLIAVTGASHLMTLAPLTVR